MKLTPEEYRMAQDQIQLIAGLAVMIPVDELLDDLALSETLGPILDPTLYRKALHSGKLDRVRELAQAVARVKAVVVKHQKLEEERLS